MESKGVDDAKTLVTAQEQGISPVPDHTDVKKALDVLLDGIRKNRVDKVDFSRKLLYPGAMDDVCAALQQCWCVEDLDLSHNKLSGAELSALADVLGASTAIVDLSLAHNPLGSAGNGQQGGDVGIHAFSHGLQRNATVQHLDLSHCQLSPHEVATIAGALASNATLTSVDLCGNKPGVRGGYALVDALETNSVLKDIALDPQDSAWYGDVQKRLEANRKQAAVPHTPVAFLRDALRQQRQHTLNAEAEHALVARQHVDERNAWKAKETQLEHRVRDLQAAVQSELQGAQALKTELKTAQALHAQDVQQLKDALKTQTDKHIDEIRKRTQQQSQLLDALARYRGDVQSIRNTIQRRVRQAGSSEHKSAGPPESSPPRATSASAELSASAARMDLQTTVMAQLTQLETRLGHLEHDYASKAPAT